MHVDAALALCQVVLKLGQVLRVTQDANGHFESDTTHSVMLALLGYELASATGGRINASDVLALATIHDMVEVLVGDTPTYRALSTDAQEAKHQREQDALVRLRECLSGVPHVVALLDRYERQACLESRFVRYLDKVMPKLTSALNYGRAWAAVGLTLSEARARHTAQHAELSAQYPEPEFDSVRALHAEACRVSETAWEHRIEAME